MLEKFEREVSCDEWPWSTIYPCPDSGCWLNVSDHIPGLVNHCGQSSCCNPSHCLAMSTDEAMGNIAGLSSQGEAPTAGTASSVTGGADRDDESMERDPLGLAAGWGLAPRFDLFRAIRAHVRAALARRSERALVVCFDNWAARIALDIAANDCPGNAEVSVVDPSDDLLAWAEERKMSVARAVVVNPEPAAAVIAPRLCGAPDPAAQLSVIRRYCDEQSDLVWSTSMCWPEHAAGMRLILGANGFYETSTGVVGRQGRLPGWFVASEKILPQSLATGPAA